MAGMSPGSGSMKSSVFVETAPFLRWPELDTLAHGPERGLMGLIEEQLSRSKTIAVVGPVALIRRPRRVVAPVGQAHRLCGPHVLRLDRSMEPVA